MASTMNFVADRRYRCATLHLAHDRLTLPWQPLQNPHSRAALIVPWLAMITALLLATYPDLAALQGLSAGSMVSFGLSPLVALSNALALFLPANWASALAAAAIPCVQLLIALALVRGTLRCLDFQGAAANIGLAIVPLLPMAVICFSPLRMPGAGWLALCALGMLRLLVDRRRVPLKSALAGLLAGIYAFAGMSGLWLVFAATLFLSIEFYRHGRSETLAAFLGALILSAGGLFVVSTPFPQWGVPLVESLSWPHLASWLLCAVVAGGCAKVARPLSVGTRIAVLFLIWATIIGTPIAVLGMSAATPLISFDPVNSGTNGHTSNWHDARGMVLATVCLWGIALVRKWHDLMRSGNSRGWFAVALLSGIMVTLSVFDWRAALYAQLLAIPLFALLLRDALRVACRFANGGMRVFAICFALLALTPTGGSYAGGIASSLADSRPLGWPRPIEHAVMSIGSLDFPG